MANLKVFVSRLIPDAGLSLLRSDYDIDVWEDELPPSRSTLLEKVKGVDGILSLLTDKIDAEVMDAAGSQLKVVSNYAVGFDNIDIPEATRRGIPVGNTPGCLTETTADFAFALLMAGARRIVEADNYVRQGNWKTWGPRLLLGQDISGATLGLIGFGRIGRAVAKRAAGFNMNVIYYDPWLPDAVRNNGHRATSVSLEELLSRSDFISLHMPLVDETRHLIDTAAFNKMKSTAVLINTARGPVVDPNALYEALKSNRITCAALDVTEPEPIEPNDPLLTLDNVIIAPHIASASHATRNTMATMAAENLIAGLNGEPLPNCVNPDCCMIK